MSATIEILRGPDRQTSRDGWEHNAYGIRIHYQGRTMAVPYMAGIAHEDQPTAEDVLYCLLSDASGYDNSTDATDWMSEYGYSPEDPQAHNTYRAVRAQTARLRTLLGDDYDAHVFPHDDHEAAAARLAGKVAA